ncbi:hypothetical protein YA0720_08425, partial [Pseudomonas carnis]|uniref:hypothetical protein n=2 Tax=Pseudomonas carnis TaxID=2487355 RepID=UPI0018E5D550
LTRADEAMPRYSQITEVLISRGVGELPSPTLLEAQTTGPDTAELEPLRVQQGTQLVVSYVGMRNGDSIKASMVGAGNGGSPDIPAKPGNETLQKVVFDISRAAIAANIRDQATTVKYQYVVTRAGVSVTSATLTVTVRPIPQSELAKTVIRLNEANSATKVLDLDSFVGNAMAHVGTWPFITAPYPVSLKFFGRTAANVAHDLTLFSFNSSYVNPNWVAQGRYEYRLLRTYLDGLGHGKKLRMEFKAAVSLSKVEAEAISFPVVEYTVNTLPAEFPVPKLTQATGTGTSVTLAPLNAQNGGTVSVEYTPMYTTDSIKVTMVGTAGAGSPVIPAKNGVATGKATFDITKAAIAANVGNADKTLTLKYDVTRNGKVVSSQVLTVTVTPIPQAELAKTVLKINQANAATQVLNLTTFTGDATGQIGVWPFITAPYPVWLKLLGKTDKGVDHSLTVYNGAGSAAVNPTWIANGKIEPGIARSYLNGLGDGTKLQVELKAAFSLSKAEADAIVFPIVDYQVIASRPKIYDYTDFNSGYNEWRNVAGGDISQLYWWGTAAKSTRAGVYKTFVNVPRGSYEISFLIRQPHSIYGAGVTVSFGAQNQREDLFVDSNWLGKKFSFSLTSELSSVVVRIEAGAPFQDNTFGIDNILVRQL